MKDDVKTKNNTIFKENLSSPYVANSRYIDEKPICLENVLL